MIAQKKKAPLDEEEGYYEIRRLLVKPLPTTQFSSFAKSPRKLTEG